MRDRLTNELVIKLFSYGYMTTKVDFSIFYFLALLLFESSHWFLVPIPTYSRETFPTQYYRWKNLEVHCDDDESTRHLPLSKNENSKLSELSFDRLQLTDQECTGLRRRNFGRFVAREAIQDEEYWVSFSLLSHSSNAYRCT